MNREIQILAESWPLYLSGFGNTLWLTACTLVLAAIGGAAVAMLMLSRIAPLRYGVVVLVDLLRTVPFLLFAYLVYYGLPVLGLHVDRWSSGLCALAVYHTAYVGEIVRGAWRNLSVEQIEAGRAHGLYGLRLFRRIIAPQLFFGCAPLIGNQTVQIVKDTAFLLIITVPELTFAASSVQSTYFIPFAAFAVAIALYWAVTLAIEAAVRGIESAAEARRAS